MATFRNSDPFLLQELRPRIGELLVSRGLISADQLATALARKEPGEKLGAALVRLEIVFEHDLVRTLASQCGLGYLDLFTNGVDVGVARLLPEATARDLDAIPVRASSGGCVVVAAADPLEIDLPELRRLVGAPVELKVAELTAIRSRLDDVWPPRRATGAQPSPPAQAVPPAEAVRPAEALDDAGAASYCVRVADPARTPHVAAYLSRLGADVTVRAQGLITVAVGSLSAIPAHREHSDLAAYLGAWSAVHGTQALLSAEP